MSQKESSGRTKGDAKLKEVQSMRRQIVLIALAHILICTIFATPSHAQTDINACFQTCTTEYDACAQKYLYDPVNFAICGSSQSVCQRDCRIQSLEDELRKVMAERTLLILEVARLRGEIQLKAEQGRLNQEAVEKGDKEREMLSDNEREMKREGEERMRIAAREAQQKKAELEELIRRGDPSIVYSCPSPGGPLTRAIITPQPDHSCVYDPAMFQETHIGDRMNAGGQLVDRQGHPEPARTSCHPSEKTVQRDPLRCSYPATLFKVTCGPDETVQPNLTCVYDPTTRNRTRCGPNEQTVQQNPLRCGYQGQAEMVQQ
jgi:hypothetical protein